MLTSVLLLLERRFGDTRSKQEGSCLLHGPPQPAVDFYLKFSQCSSSVLNRGDEFAMDT